jgi:hypothetical protein
MDRLLVWLDLPLTPWMWRKRADVDVEQALELGQSSHAPGRWRVERRLPAQSLGDGGKRVHFELHPLDDAARAHALKVRAESNLPS